MNIDLKSYLEKHCENVTQDLEWFETKLPPNDVLVHHGVKGQKWGVKNGPPYPIERNNKLVNAAGQQILQVTRISLSGEPNSITQVKNKNGGITRNYYDDTGRQSKQMSNHNHGNSKKHPFGKHGEHAHDYIYDNDGNLISREPRDLSPEERKENDDIL